MTEITANITLDDRAFDIMESIEGVHFMEAQNVEDVGFGSRSKE